MKIYSWNQLWSGLLCGGLLIWWGTQAYSETPALALTQFSLAALLVWPVRESCSARRNRASAGVHVTGLRMA